MLTITEILLIIESGRVSCIIVIDLNPTENSIAKFSNKSEVNKIQLSQLVKFKAINTFPLRQAKQISKLIKYRNQFLE